MARQKLTSKQVAAVRTVFGPESEAILAEAQDRGVDVVFGSKDRLRVTVGPDGRPKVNLSDDQAAELIGLVNQHLRRRYEAAAEARRRSGAADFFTVREARPGEEVDVWAERGLRQGRSAALFWERATSDHDHADRQAAAAHHRDSEAGRLFTGNGRRRS